MAIFSLSIAAVVWWITAESPTIRRARPLAIGQTIAEVDAIMKDKAALTGGDGDGHLVRLYATPGEGRVFAIRRQLVWWLGGLGLPDQFVEFEYPVEVHFEDGRVTYIRRGRKRLNRSVKAPATPAPQ